MANKIRRIVPATISLICDTPHEAEVAAKAMDAVIEVIGTAVDVLIRVPPYAEQVVLSDGRKAWRARARLMAANTLPGLGPRRLNCDFAYFEEEIGDA